jgi:UDP-3-O-[3-hydroxymyristoyl] glucosamine N-acyltransferase
MEHPGFFERAGPFRLRDVADAAQCQCADAAADLEITDLMTLDDAGEGHLTFLENRKYLENFRNTRASACFVSEKYAGRAPEGLAVLISEQPYRSFALALGLFYPDALRPKTAGSEGWAEHGTVHPTAHLEDGVEVEPGASIGVEARIGAGTRIAAGAAIGYRVHIGRNCYIGPNVTVTHALIGDRVLLHAGVCIGQDGFGFAMGSEGHLKVPQIGRVIIQDDVEIGANSAVDRGVLYDSIIGEGTKIDNLVQIGHNVIIGRHCVIVSQTGISGSAELGDFVVLGGQVGVVGHVKIGDGANIAATSNVNSNVPPGVTWGGTPAKPMRLWFREVSIVKKLAEDAEEKHKQKTGSGT